MIVFEELYSRRNRVRTHIVFFLYHALYLNVDFLSFTPKKNINTLLYGNKKYKKDVKTYILNQTINYINKSKRFEKKTNDDQAET